MKKLFEKYWHILPMLFYMAIYLAWFYYVENRPVVSYTEIHMNIDDKIPFMEIFIIPYLFWFGFVAAMVIYLFFTDKKGYFKACAFLVIGMTVFLIISTVFPNQQHLRPTVMPRDNIFSRMVSGLYKTDTPTNLWPSIHVYNSLAVYIAAVHDKRIGNSKILRRIVGIISVLIIMSTLFLKQHSMFDVLTAFAMAVVVYALVYRTEYAAVTSSEAGVRKSRKRGGMSINS